MSLDVNSITVTFGGLRALEDVTISLEAGEVSALIGPNGAGKTTLFNCISGFVTPSSGVVSIDGLDVTRERVDRRISRGLARTFQTPRVHPDASVAENILVGLYPRTRSRLSSTIFRTPRQRREDAEMRAAAGELVREFGFDDVAGASAGDLPLGRLRILELARAMAMSPRYLLLDEPAAGLDPEERDLLADHIRALSKLGVGVLLVEHNFAFVRELASRLTVLLSGKVLASGEPAEVERDPAVVDAYLGVQA